MRVFRWIFVVTFLLILTTCGTQMWENSSRRVPEANKTAVAWLDDHRLLLQTEHSVIVRSTPDGEEQVLFEIAKEDRSSQKLATSCYAKSLWRLHIWTISGSIHSSSGAFYAVHLDESGAVKQVEFVQEAGWSFEGNDIDCTWVHKNDLSGEPIKNFNVENRRDDGEWRTDLFSTQVMAEVVVGARDGDVQFSFSDGVETTTLDLPFGYPRRGLTSSLETGAPYSYFIYKRDLRDFGMDEHWPYTFWHLDLKDMSSRRVELPAGPWVGDTEERFQCFSCGCGCYRRGLFSAHDQTVLLRINGIGFSAKSQGIYKIDTKALGQGWEKIIKGPTNGPIVVSPNGCQLAYTKKVPKVANLC